MKIREASRRDFAAYARWRRLERRWPRFCPWPEPLPERGPTPTVEAFVRAENGERGLRPRHPRAWRAAVEGKRLLNWQIKQWAESAAELGAAELDDVREAFAWLPAWVWTAVEQARKARRV